MWPFLLAAGRLHQTRQQIIITGIAGISGNPNKFIIVKILPGSVFLPVFLFIQCFGMQAGAKQHSNIRVGNFNCCTNLCDKFFSVITHNDIPQKGFARNRQLVLLMRAGSIRFAGNRSLKIYGTLSCSSGKRMKTSNQVFFTNEKEAIGHGFRPCGHCMRYEYRRWKEIKH